jgi:hypothetical protein
MQKEHIIDYSNTLFYKIFCKDVSITDLYIGHTTNFVQRKSAHKQSCVNPKSANYKLKLYNVIRENGGWTNWQMDIIAYHHCKDHYDARTKEQEYFISYNATLNSIEPMPRLKCEKQLIVPSVKNNNVQCTHLCDVCDYATNSKKDYNKHIHTRKHIRLITDKSSSTPVYKCDCNKIYQYQSGLCKHKRRCAGPYNANSIGIDVNAHATTGKFVNLIKEIVSSKDNHIAELLKQNQEFKEIMIEQNKHMMELIKTRAT